MNSDPISEKGMGFCFRGEVFGDGEGRVNLITRKEESHVLVSPDSISRSRTIAGGGQMKNILKTEESTLKRLLYHFRLVPYYSTADLRKEMRQFVAFIKKPECLRLTDEEKIKAFRIERAGVSNDSKDVNFPAAAAWAYLISIGRKSLKDLTSEKRQLTLLDYERVKAEGIWEDDPPELKEYCDKYQIYLKEAKKWDMPIPTVTLKRWFKFKLTEKGEFEKYYKELTKKIASWMKRYPSATLAEMIRPNQNCKDMLKWLAEKPIEEGGIGIPYPDKYPFGVYFLTVNIMAKLYGNRREIMGAILNRISKPYRKAKDKSLSSEETEDLSIHYEGYESVIKHLAHVTAWEILNLEAYFNTTFANLRKPKATRIIPESHLPKKQVMDEEGVEEEEQSPLETILRKGLSDSTERAIKFKETYDLVKNTLAFDEEQIERIIDTKAILSSMKKECREAINLRLEGFTQEETALKIGCSVKTIFLWERDFISRKKN